MISLSDYKHVFIYSKTLFGSLEGKGRKGKTLKGAKYEEKWRNFSKNLKQLFFRE